MEKIIVSLVYSCMKVLILIFTLTEILNHVKRVEKKISKVEKKLTQTVGLIEEK